MVVVLRPIWHKVGDAFLGKKCHFEVAYGSFVGKKRKQALREICSLKGVR